MKNITLAIATVVLSTISISSLAQTKFITDDGINSTKQNSISFGKTGLSAAELLYEVNPNESVIKWHTDNETNMSHFELQVSSDGINFTEVSKVAASDYTQWKTDYKVTFRKRYLSAKKVFYRVKAVFSDNSVEYSSSVAFTVSNNNNEPVYASLH